MKITNEHYTHIKTSIENVITQYGYNDIMNYKAKLISGEIPCKDANVRLMFDLQRKAGLLNFVCDTIYQYANDDHYQTALFKAGKELNLI
jgi:hypothetical protein